MTRTRFTCFFFYEVARRRGRAQGRMSSTLFTSALLCLLRPPTLPRRAPAVRACDTADEDASYVVGERIRGLYGASALGITFGCKWFDGEIVEVKDGGTYRVLYDDCLIYTSPSPRDS